MRQMMTWLKSILQWLAEWRLFILGFLVVAAPAAYILFVSADEPVIRYSGMALQLFGICTVAWGIHTTRREFDHPSIFTIWSKRLSRFPPFGGQLVTGNANITIPAMSLSARGYSSVVAGPTPTIDERVQALEDNLKLVNDRISQTQNGIDMVFHKQSESIKQEQQIRSDEDECIRAKIKYTETNGLHISAMGALWLFIGVILSTIPNEMAGWLK